MKANIGHLEAASALASIVKAICELPREQGLLYRKLTIVGDGSDP